jgi:hypothetical protein
VEIRTSYLAFMLTACCEHSASRGVVWSTHYLTKEAKLSCHNHVYDTWDVIEHSSNLVISDVVFLNLHYGNVEYSSNAVVEEDFKLSKEILSEPPVFTSPE